MTQVAIYDKRNTDRLLGYFAERPMSRIPGKHYCLRIATVVQMMTANPPIYMYGELGMTAPEVRAIDFTVTYRDDDDGYTLHAVFHTDAPLKDLMCLSQFVLPGESRRAAKERRYRMAYGG